MRLKRSLETIKRMAARLPRERRSTMLESALFRISELSRSASDLGELYASIHRIVGELMDATNFYIALYDAASDELHFPYFVDEFDANPGRLHPGGTLTSIVLRTGRVLLVDPYKFEEMRGRGEVQGVGAPSLDWLGVPLSHGGSVFGVLVVQSYHPHLRFGEREKDLLLFVSQHVASAIEHKRREEALRSSETRYRQMFENNRAVKLLIDPTSGFIVDANQAACDFYGYPKSHLTTMRIWEINTLTPEEVKVELGRAATQKRTFFQFRHRIASGEIRDVEIQTGPIDSEGRPLLYSIIQDVTERKRAEAALRASEEKYRNIFDYASIGIYQTTPSGTIVTANQRLATMLGYASPEELLGIAMTEVYFNPSDRDELIRRYDPQGSAAELEVMWRRRDGSPLWIQLNAHAARDESGQTLYYEGFVHDITSRKTAEQVLRSHSAAIEAAMDGIAIFTAAGDLRYMNQAFAKLFGHRTKDEVLGRHWRVLFHEGETRRLQEDVLPRVRSVGQWRGEMEARRRDGSMFPSEVSLTLLDAGEVVAVARDVTERTYAEEQIRHLAYHDALTGLPNRLLFKDRLTVAINHARRDDTRLAVLFLDLDQFKLINDSLGHNAGDHLLQQVGARLQQTLRESDTVARLGGDEFTVLLPRLPDPAEAMAVATKILHAVRLPFTLDQKEYYITTSVGVSLYPDDGVDAESLIKNADTAMYQAKDLGRNTVQMVNAGIKARAVERLSLESGLRRAVAAEEFVLHYQPIYDYESGRLYGMEALVRWMHPTLGLVPPNSFIPLAETAGIMPEIGRWVLRKACTDLASWQKKGAEDLTLAVNLSVTQISQPDLVEQTVRILEETGIDPASLELEITESMAMQNPETCILRLHELKKRGIRISLDDFGTGHSSLSYLKSFPIDTLKIDQSFVRDLTIDTDTAAIVTAIIAMAYSLRLNVIAEGVEQEDHRKFLAKHGCSLMQGFLFEKPIPSEEFERLLFEGAGEHASE